MDNPSFIDVYREGNAAEWTAIGFSLSAKLVRSPQFMYFDDNSGFLSFSACLSVCLSIYQSLMLSLSLSKQGRDDVLGCRVDSGSVTVVDTWNPSAGQVANVLDATQAGLCVQATSFTNNRITCQ